MLDLDHFKAINDRYGHAHGDEVLAGVGAAIRAALRSGDLAGRFGGEEFLVLLPETTAAEGEEVAERIRRTIAGISVPGVDREITASLGIAELRQHAGNASGLLQEADKAQYAAKAGGRNRCVVAAQPEQDAPLEEPAYLSSASS
jgi:diguanylate cyclase (GGDEF)-like protein